MAVIRVILGGCGVTYTDKRGIKRHVLKTPADKPFEVDDEQAARLVARKVAEYVTEPAPEDDAQDAPSGDSEKLTGHLDPADLETMTNENLKKLAVDMGLDVSGCKKKADYVAIIAAAEVEVDMADATDDPDDLPDLAAADPE